MAEFYNYLFYRVKFWSGILTLVKASGMAITYSGALSQVTDYGGLA